MNISKNSLLVLAAAALAPALSAQCWHAAADFSDLNNPNGEWTYGWSSAQTTPLAPPTSFFAYDQRRTTNGGLEWWFEPTRRPELPAVIGNVLPMTIGPISQSLSIPARGLIIHPGPDNEHSIVRWTAPRTGSFSVSAAFTPIDGDYESVDVHVLQNGVGVWTDEPAGGVASSYTATLVLSAGDQIDFSVGIGSNDFFNDSVRLDVHVDEQISGPGWECLGNDLAGSLGDPYLVGSGSLTGGSPVSLDLSLAAPNQAAVLIVGGTRIDVPFLGGVFVPAPTLAVGIVTDAAGDYGLPFVWPAGVPSGLSVYYQAWIPDPAAVLGVAASNAVASRT